MSDKFNQWCVVEVMGHKKFAGRVTEGPFGMVQVDVPEVTLSSGAIVPPFTKLLGAHAIYAMTPCTEETARAFAREFRSQAFQTYEIPALTAPKPRVFTSTPSDSVNQLFDEFMNGDVADISQDERDPEWDADNDDLEADEEAFRKAAFIIHDEFHSVPSQEDIDQFVAALGVDVPARDPQLEEGLEPLPITPVPECSRKYVSGKACLLCGDGACFQIAARPDLDPDDGEPF